MKKTFAFVCACMFGLSVIGCGGDAATPTETPEATPADTEATTTDAGATDDSAKPVDETATEGEAETTDATTEGDATPTE